MTHAATARAKVVLVGDHHQLPEIEAGGVFRALVARTDPVRLTVNRRQHERHAREMLDLWRQSRVREAMTIATEHGELVTAGSAEELQTRIVNDYCAAITGGEDAVMVTLHRAEARELNAEGSGQRQATGTERRVSDPDEALGERPRGLLAQVAWRRARRALEDARRELAKPASIGRNPPRRGRSL